MQNFLKNFVEYVERNKKIILTVIVVVALAAVVTGSAGINLPNIVSTSNSNLSVRQGVSSGGTGMVAPSAATKGDYYGEVAYDRGSSGIAPMPPIYNNPPASTPTLPTDRKVIQNGSLDLRVLNADIAAKQVADIADVNNGFVDNSNIYEISDGVKAGSITVRVPADKFTTAMEAIKKIALKVNRENVSSNDVTAQVVDLEAQIKNYQAEEKQYREIMARTVKIQDVLDVAGRLSDVQGRIERTQGQLNYLSRQVSMSTISVSMTAEPEVKVFGIVWRPFTIIQQAFKSMLTDLVGFVNEIIRFVFKLPIIILRLGLFAAVFWALWKIIRRIAIALSRK